MNQPEDTAELDRVRAQSSYPRLRELIALVYWLGMCALVIVAVVLVGVGVADIRSTADAGWGAFWLGVAAIVVAGLWAVAFKPAASLLVDIADLLVELVRQGKRND